MNRQVLSKALSAFVTILLLLQALLFVGTARSFEVMFRGAQNVQASDPLPGFVWQYVAGACLFLMAAIAYLFALIRIRQWFIAPAGLSFIYGFWAYQQSSSILMSWSGIFRGDIVALEVGSYVLFCAIGIAGVLDWKIR